MLIRRIARPLLSVAFIGQGVDALRNPKPAADAARPALDGMRKLPDPVGTNVPSDAETFARINAAVQIGGGLLLATGKMPRLASAALAFTVIPGSLGGHMFWSESDPQRKAEERRAFMTDLSLLGGLIIAAVDTEGKPSLGWRGRRAARKVSEAVTAALPVGAASGGALADSAIRREVGPRPAGRRRARTRIRATSPANAARNWPRSPANAHPKSPRPPANAQPNWPRSPANAHPKSPRPPADAPPSSPRSRANAHPSSPRQHGNVPRWRANGQATSPTRRGHRPRQQRRRWS